ncbi:hypothetical protein Adu01nite_60700 [Paractinoplanes durhamensis]|uniref:Uncharacterized protein n=1 Tax=Paractinoplanes durhamensis TaxID=113563 RepID=A0ABQ3Z4I5_9ACTN|nr:hypothetical protein Adu01nite_60700 [Actinoplanes durhamensis]
MREWGDRRGAEVLGPLDTAGMDPTWILRLRGRVIEAEVALFYGPRAEVAAYQLERPEDGMFVAWESGVSASRLVELLDGLGQWEGGGERPGWLRVSSF